MTMATKERRSGRCARGCTGDTSAWGTQASPGQLVRSITPWGQRRPAPSGHSIVALRCSRCVMRTLSSGCRYVPLRLDSEQVERTRLVGGPGHRHQFGVATRGSRTCACSDTRTVRPGRSHPGAGTSYEASAARAARELVRAQIVDPIDQDEDVDWHLDHLRGVAMHEGDATSVEKPSGTHDSGIDVVAEPSRRVNVGQQLAQAGTNFDDRAGRQSIDDVDDHLL